MAQTALITTRVELDRAFEESATAPVLIFKHSLICPVSTWALKTFSDFVEAQEAGEVLCTLIRIQGARDLSDEVARRTGIRHESPQAVLLRNGQAVWHASHWDISAESLARALANGGA